MQDSVVKTKLRAGEPVLAVKLMYQDPALYELVGRMGFDCAWICNEHVAIDPSAMVSIIRACRASGMDAMIRTKPGSYRDLIHVLEQGARGIMLPRNRTLAEVRQAVEDMKFAPLGRRGADGVHAEADFGFLPLPAYLQAANANTFLVVQIEDPEIIEHLDAIAAMDGVDVLLVGPGDLSVNLGAPGQVEHPAVMKVCDQVLAACARHGKAAGMACGTLERVQRYRAMGFQFVTGPSDYGTIRSGFESFRNAAAQVGFRFRA